VLMIEAENTDFAAADVRWTLESSQGEQYIEYDKTNNMTGVYKLKKVGKLCYPVRLRTPGWWKMRMLSINGHSTEHNDVWTHLEQVEWYSVHPKSCHHNLTCSTSA